MHTAHLPATFVSSGWGTPTVCAPHGEAAAEHRRVTFRSPPPGWVIALIVLSPLAVVIGALCLQKRVKATAWPFCAQCGRSSRVRRIVTAGVFAAFAVMIGVTIAIGESQQGPAALVGSLALLVAGFVALSNASNMKVAGAAVTVDGVWVSFRNAREAFVAQVMNTMAAAAQHPTQPFPAPESPAPQSRAPQYPAQQAAAPQLPEQHAPQQ